ncbi:MAG: alpha-L-arabinofuranosidase C-terminal domain-containing protein, partial [Bacteroidales bacterium]|nr:alpha-L-arabinofuranosidase C-terminal domain-containing protein [Bacteroidales bacterium]
DVFLKRYNFLIEGVKKAHPEITVIGTVGPFWEGSDYEYGWKEAKAKNIEIVDEHYYNPIGWYFHHRDYYDNYDRQGTKVYLGEWASKGNNVVNALVEAAYLTNVERNADVVVMSSYAPLLAKEGHTNWNPDLIYFNNTEIHPTANYYVQRAFGQNAGSRYVYSDLNVNGGNDVTQRLDKSVVIDEVTGDIIIKVVSLLPKQSSLTVNIPAEALEGHSTTAELTVLSKADKPDSQRNWDTNETRTINVAPSFSIDIPQYSLSVIRIKKDTKRKK